MSELRDQAERKFLEALEARGAIDPRDRYRGWLRELKQTNLEGYRKAVSYYEEELIPAVAGGTCDPLEEWLEFGRMVLTMAVDGRTLQIDTTGFATPYARPVAGDRLVLHLPTSTRQDIVALSVPVTPSPAQSATYDLLVLRRVG